MVKNSEKKKFVYVVCGDAEHLLRLHLSLKILKKYTKYDIVVVTDPKKNRGEIRHDTVIRASTPGELTPHQSAVFLKTGISKYLDTDTLYAYIDTDMIARSKKVDDVFHLFTPPVSFARDYVDMQHFSPVAVNCRCLEDFREHERKLIKLFKKYDPNFYRLRNENNRKKISAIDELNRSYPKDIRWSIYRKWKQRFDPENLYLTDFTHYAEAKLGYTWDDASQSWFDEDGKVIYTLDHSYRDKIERDHDYYFDKKEKCWKTESGVAIHDRKCSHLQDAIVRMTGKKIPGSWRHWNGGLFLFNRHSETFLNDWHQTAVKTFKDSFWVTRDQGALAAAVWKAGLQEAPVISNDFNFIVSFRYQNVKYLGKNRFVQTADNRIIKPVFIHLIDGITPSTRYFWRIENGESGL